MQDLPLDEPQIRFIVISSDNQSYRKYLSQLVESYDCHYVRFSGDVLGLNEAKTQLFEQFDRYAQDDMPEVLILDECDRLASDVYSDLLYALEDLNLSKVVMFSRQPLLIMQSTSSTSTITYITSKQSDVIASYDEHSPSLEVSGFGVGQVWVNGKAIDFLNHPLLHEFFFYILEHHAFLRVDALEAFWSSFDQQSAVSNFHVARKNLDRLLGLEFLIFSGTHYERNSSIQLRYDVADYCRQINNISFESSEPTELIYRKVYQLYQGDFLSTFDSEWVMKLRVKLRQQQSDICFALGESLGMTDEALGYYTQAFRLNPYRDDVALAMMQYYLAQGLRQDALAVYQRLKDNVKYRSDILPNKTLNDLAEQIKANF